MSHFVPERAGERPTATLSHFIFPIVLWSGVFCSIYRWGTEREQLSQGYTSAGTRFKSRPVWNQEWKVWYTHCLSDFLRHSASTSHQQAEGFLRMPDLDKSHNHFEPQFPHQQNESNICLTELLRRLEVIHIIKCGAYVGLNKWQLLISNKGTSFLYHVLRYKHHG